MSDRNVLSNRRRFPRARLCCDVVYGDRIQSWHSRTRNISLGGCRIAGYYPFQPGRALALKMTHPSVPDEGTMIAKVARLDGGAENAISLVFDKHWRGNSKFENWICKVMAKDADAARTISHTLDHLPMEARLRRAAQPQIERRFSPGEMVLLQRLDKSLRPVPLVDLRAEWGPEWERKAQVVFDLIADGIVLCSLKPEAPTPAPTIEEFAVQSFFKTSTKLMKDLESEYGPLDRTFARELETLTQEVIQKASSDRVLKQKKADAPILPHVSGRTKRD